MTPFNHNDELWVFLSHSNQDFEQVRHLRNIMEEKGMRPLMFFLKCLDEEPEIFNLIKREIDVRPRFILCDSENAQKSEWVQKEVEYIKSKQRPFVTIDLNRPETYEDRVQELKRRAQIFISHSCHNNIDIARKIENSLTARGFNTSTNFSNIDYSCDFALTIYDNIEEACKNGYFLPIITTDYIRSGFGRQELKLAIELNGDIIPCIVADSDEQMHSIIKEDPKLEFLLARKPYKRLSPNENLDQSVEEFCDWIVRVDLARNR